MGEKGSRWLVDPVSVIVAALVVGARAGTSATATATVKDAYASLKAELIRRVADAPGGEIAIEQFATDPETWRRPVEKTLHISGAVNDPEILAKSQQLLELADPDGVKAGRYAVSIVASGQRSVAAGSNISGGIVTGDANVFLDTVRG